MRYLQARSGRAGIGLNSMDRRVFLGGLAASIPAATWASPPTTALRPLLRNAANMERAASATTRFIDPALAAVSGFVLLDARTHAVIDAYQADISLPPASVTKAITAVYARQTLGPDYRFVTRVLATGPVVNGKVQGDLYLVGGGDPALDTDELARLAAALVARGIRGATGRFYVDGSALPMITEIDDSQPDYLGYNAAVNGLNLNFNRVYFEWKQQDNGYRLSLDARAERHTPLVKWVDISAENRGAPVFRYSKVNGHDRWSVAQSALGAEGGRWLPVRQPADYVGDVFKTLAAAKGLALPAHRHGVAPDGASEVARFESEKLDDVIRWLLKYSNNMTAECLGLTATKALGQEPLSLRDSSNYMGQWVQTNLGGRKPGFINHSGLTDKARVSPMQMAGMLAQNRSKFHLNNLLKQLVMLDNTGNRMDTGGVRITAKTGSLNFTHALAGYLEKGGLKYPFAIFASDLEARARVPMAQRERPPGARTWAGKAKRQEMAILRNWLQKI